MKNSEKPPALKSSIFAGVIPDVRDLDLVTKREAFNRADTERGVSRRTFNLAELFNAEELRRPEECVLELYTALATENTNGMLVSRALVSVVSRPMVRSGEPYRGDPTTEAAPSASTDRAIKGTP